ncbi:NADH:flavin oxidoreductase/NADH oxidase family protein, partial [Ramlibacter sp.]|uniref:NADH:flavin oxidoreductase/NADH oxidase family protein n=1 Tax=Ramlibacter sp. TaxID=1917967 RepID=UPI00183CFBE1
MLDSPFTFPCGLAVPNRIAKSSMTERMADPAGTPSPRLARLFQRYAEGGAGFLLTGNVVVDGQHLEGFGNAILEDGRQLDAFQAWAVAGRSRGGAMVMQLNHPGRQAMRAVTQQPVAPSAVGLPNRRFFAVPQALSDAGVRGVIDAFVRSASLAERAGFSGVELHAAHGYLLSQFLSPHVNQRTDRWGGSVENRARVIVEIVERIRARVSPSFAVGIKLNAGDFVKGGMSPEEATQVMRLLDPLGLDFIEVSGGTFERPASFGHGLPESTLKREGYFLEMARRARDATRVPLIVTGGLRSAAAIEQALADGSCDLVGLARPL